MGRIYSKNRQRFPGYVRYGDIVKGLPVALSSCKGIYCSHVLEHLSLVDVDLALRHTFQYLKSGGTFRLVVPDLRRIAEAYISDPSDTAAHRFIEMAGLGQRERARGLVAFLKNWLGHSVHLWMWDEKSMTAKLREHGFVEVRRAKFGDAEDRRFIEVEDEGRFDGCLAMQCRKA